MPDNALIIFVRKAEKGKVKTRLASTIGNDLALKVYKELLRYTKSVIDSLDVDVFIFYAGEIVENDSWNGNHKELQTEGDLGKKMFHAFEKVFNRGYEKVIIIGSDCAELKTKTVEDAFDGLNSNDFVIGPAKDGGYYLLGMNYLYKNIFENMPWSQHNLLEETKKKIEKKSYKLLETLSDIDYEDDLMAVDWLRTYLERIKKR